MVTSSKFPKVTRLGHLVEVNYQISKNFTIGCGLGSSFTEANEGALVSTMQWLFEDLPGCRSWRLNFPKEVKAAKKLLRDTPQSVLRQAYNNHRPRAGHTFRWSKVKNA